VAIAILWRVMFGEGGFVVGILADYGIRQSSLVGNPSTALWLLILLNV
jgi:multiple sugar transport system permease protein